MRVIRFIRVTGGGNLAEVGDADVEIVPNPCFGPDLGTLDLEALGAHVFVLGRRWVIVGGGGGGGGGC